MRFLARQLNAVTFSLREQLLGRLRLRAGAPRLPAEKSLAGEHAYYRLLLSRISESDPGLLQAIDACVDVGCRNWSYAPALARFFPRADLLGIELDGGRRYWNLYRRRDFADAFARRAAEQSGRGASCLFRDFTSVGADELRARLPRLAEATHAPGALLFTFFYPFVSERPCLKWGLPASFAGFSPLLRHARELAPRRSALVLLSAHQGEWERELALRAYAEAGLETRSTLIPAKEFEGLWPSAHDTHLIWSREEPKNSNDAPRQS
ncbi:MAG: hypothetical protein NDJ90_14730 [Oligoflexia bacterium]|nr:hypothetical protein [Oligoflexia bacterium]